METTDWHGQGSPRYMFHVQLGDTSLTFYNDGTCVQVFPPEDRVPPDVCAWKIEAGVVVVEESNVESGWDRSVDEVQSAYQQWYDKLARVIAKEIVK